MPNSVQSSDPANSDIQLVVYYDGTFVHRRNGAHVRITALLDHLVGAGYRLALFSFENHVTEPWTDEAKAEFARQFPGVELVLDQRTKRLIRATRLRNALTALFPRSAARLMRWRLAGASPNYEALVARAKSAPWIINYADGLTQLNGLPPGPILVETHDLKFVGAAKFTHASPISARVLLKMRSEVSVLSQTQGVLAISPPEAGVFRALLAHTPVYYIPSYAAVAVSRGAAPPQGYAYDLVFVGSEMTQNEWGLAGFLTANRDWIGGLKIAVAGKVAQSAGVRAAAAGLSGVSLLGFVDDLPGLYAASKAALSPVDGTGMKIKTIEALAHGRPVFASSHTMAGLAPGYGRCVFPIERQGMLGRLADETALAEAQAQAAAYYEALPAAGDLVAFDAALRAAI